jgi:hypothetical protein
MSCTLVHGFVVCGHDVLRGVFPFVNKGMHATAVSLVPGMPTAGVRVVLVWSFVPVCPVPVVVPVLLVLH